MEVKKNPKADLTRKTSFFFSIGLLVTMSIVLTAFEWRQHELKIEDFVQRNIDVFDDMDVLATEIPPPPPPAVVKVPIIVEVEDTEEIEDAMPAINIEVSSLTALVPVTVTAVVDEPEVTEEIFRFVESPASFDGGLNAFYKFLRDKIKYPPQARRMNIEGKVYVEFVIDKDGSIIDAVALNSVGGGCDEEAVRLVRNAPKWNPGKQRGKPVKQRMVISVIFALSH